MEIETRRLRLVLQTPEELARMIESMSEYEKSQLSADWLARFRVSTGADPWVHGFRLQHRESGAVIGTCSFKGPPEDGIVEIAYGVAPDQEGRGFATEAARGLVDYAFAHGDVRLVRAHTLPGASASKRVLAKCGFRYVGGIVDPEDGPVSRFEVEAGTLTGTAIDDDRPPLGPVTLTGRFVRLEPLRHAHVDDLLRAAADDRIWTWLPRRLQERRAIESFVANAMARERDGKEFPFAVVLLNPERVVGSTRFMDVNVDDRGVEIGWTWYSPDVWGGRLNPEAKLLLMRHAFETWRAIRVYFKTDEKNERSRAAIMKLGAKFEGILRNHRIRQDGSYRGSAVYSVIESEWPDVERRLIGRLPAE